MKITNETKELFRTEDYYIYPYRLCVEEDLEIDLEKTLMVLGNVSISGNLKTNVSLFILGQLNVVKNIDAFYKIDNFGEISGGCINATMWIEANGDIDAARLRTYGNISTHGKISAIDIFAESDVSAKGILAMNDVEVGGSIHSNDYLIVLGLLFARHNAGADSYFVNMGHSDVHGDIYSDRIAYFGAGIKKETGRLISPLLRTVQGNCVVKEHLKSFPKGYVKF